MLPITKTHCCSLPEYKNILGLEIIFDVKEENDNVVRVFLKNTMEKAIVASKSVFEYEKCFPHESKALIGVKTGIQLIKSLLPIN